MDKYNNFMEETFYNILEIPETASKDEIKKAYRKLSLKWHPDKNPGNGDAISKFQKISEAYETLSDDSRKQAYDNRNNNPFARMHSMNGNGRGGVGPEFENIDEIFSTLFGNAFGGMGGIHGMGGFPGGPNIHIFRNGVPINMMQKPTPIIKTIEISMEQVLNGGNIPVDIERWIIENGNKVFEKETLYVEIPKGVDDNEIVILRDKGNVLNEMARGDIKLFIKVQNETEFKRHGLDLIYDKTISLKESLCGFSFELKYVNGKVYTIHNNSGNIIVPDYNKIIPNMGVTRENHVGNLIIHFNVVFPESLTKEAIEKLQEIL